MRIFKTKIFSRFASGEGIGDAELCKAVSRAEVGLIDAELGGGLIKQRLARQGQGRSGGYRVILVIRFADRAIFIHGFAKNDRDNIRDDELKALKSLANDMLGLDDETLDQAIKDGKLKEIFCHEKDL